jgi:hypothetical protein
MKHLNLLFTPPPPQEMRNFILFEMDFATDVIAGYGI